MDSLRRPRVSRSFSRKIKSLLFALVAAGPPISIAMPASATVTYEYTGDLLSHLMPGGYTSPNTPGLVLLLNLPAPLDANFSGDVTPEVLANGFSLTGPNGQLRRTISTFLPPTNRGPCQSTFQPTATATSTFGTSALRIPTGRLSRAAAFRN